MRPAIRVDQISKLYRLGERKAAYRTLRESLTNFAAAPYQNFRRAFTRPELPTGEERISGDAFWALRDVSFDVQQGEVVGIIGRNGAGKSTLLKLLSRITEPTSGRIELRGRVSSLLEVGTGFHPELTGRENIHLNGSILGMRHHEIDRKFDEIVAFAGVEDFLDTPVKRYSSGMYVRLAFAVAAHLEPEILIVDEVLAVGDAEFQKKCLGKMQDVARHGRTVLFVSHNMAAVFDLCQRVLLLKAGAVVASGPPREIVPEYHGLHDLASQFDCADDVPDRTGSGPLKLLFAQLLNSTNQQQSTFRYEEEIRIQLRLATPFQTAPIIGLSIRSHTGHVILHLNNTDDACELPICADHTTITVAIKRLPLNDGEYSLTVWIGDGTNILNDRVPDCLRFRVDTSGDGAIRCQAPVRIKANWLVDSASIQASDALN